MMFSVSTDHDRFDRLRQRAIEQATNTPMTNCKSTEDLSEATTKLLSNDANLNRIELEFRSGGDKFSQGELEEFTRAMETSITNLQLEISLKFHAPIEKNQAACIKKIVQCHSIQYLILEGDPLFDHFTSIYEALSRNSAIQKLKICFSKSAATIAKSLRSKTSSLKSLNLRKNDMGDEGCSAVMEALRNYPSLKSLNVSKCSIGTEGAKAIGQLLLSSECAIEELDLCDNYDIFYDDGVAVMAGLLEKFSIRVLRMGYCDIEKESAKFIANALRSGKCVIEELELHQNFGIGDGGCAMIMKALRNNNSIHKLDLSACSIGDVGINAIAKVLQNNHAPCLRTLSLSCNRSIRVAGFKTLAISLSQNSSLENLDLSGCYVDYGGCTALMNALCQNSTLKVVNLEYCLIGNKGGKAVANFLKSNVGSIHDLNLHSNSLNEESLIEIVHALPFNTHLTKLSLFHGSKLTKKVQIALDDAAFRNYSLRELDMRDDEGSWTNDYNCKKSIEKNLDVNKKLGPVKAEMVKTGSFPHWILSVTTASCFVEALSRLTSLNHLGPLFDLVCEQPMLFDLDDCVVERPTKKAK